MLEVSNEQNSHLSALGSFNFTLYVVAKKYRMIMITFEVFLSTRRLFTGLLNEFRYVHISP